MLIYHKINPQIFIGTMKKINEPNKKCYLYYRGRNITSIRFMLFYC